VTTDLGHATRRVGPPAELELMDWRHRVSDLYSLVRAEPDAELAHALWRRGRGELFTSHPQSPLEPEDPLRRTGVPYWPYVPGLRFELELLPFGAPVRSVGTGGEEVTTMRAIGKVEIPSPVGASVAVWWLAQYGGGLFLPIRDGTSGKSSYGGGRYLFDTAKGAGLGGTYEKLVVDLNFLYHPSCRYSPQYTCPLAPPENTIAWPIEAGERLS